MENIGHIVFWIDFNHETTKLFTKLLFYIFNFFGLLNHIFFLVHFPVFLSNSVNHLYTHVFFARHAIRKIHIL